MMLSETRNYWNLRRIQQLLEEGKLRIPLQRELQTYQCSIETFAKNTLTLYLTNTGAYEPALTIRCYKDTTLICFQVDTLTPEPEQPVNVLLLNEIFDEIGQAMPEGKLALVQLSCGKSACTFIGALGAIGSSKLEQLFTRVNTYLTSPVTHSAYQTYLNEFATSTELQTPISPEEF
jgi:hypothetical protein